MGSDPTRFERDLARRLRALVDDGVLGATDAATAASRATTQRARWKGPVFQAATGAVAVVVLLLALSVRLSQTAPDGALPSSPALQTGPYESTVASLPSATQSSGPSTWVLGELDPPAGHPDFVVKRISRDGRTVVFQDLGVSDHLYVGVGSAVVEIATPGHVAGSAMSGRLSVDASFVLVYDSGSLWRYDLATKSVAKEPPPPDGLSIGSFELVSDTRAAVLTGRSDVPIHPTTVWYLDLTTGTWTEAADRTDSLAVIPTARGLVLVVDTSPQHDNSALHLYLVGQDKTDHLLVDLSGAAALAVAVNGEVVAYSIGGAGEGGSWLMNTSDGTKLQLGSDGLVQGFSPDGAQIELFYPKDGHVAALRLDGTQVISLPRIATAVWLPSP